MIPQLFKGDDIEKKFVAVATPMSDILLAQKQLFLEEAFSTFILGEVLWDTKRAPLTNAIRRDIFREAFSAIFEAFYTIGSFESYLLVFRKVFGDDVEVEFVVPAPGKLEINILAAGIELSDFVARYISNDAYIFDEVIDDEGDNIVFQGIKGFTSQYELEQMLFEMVPDGIFTDIDLTLGA